MFFLVFLWFLFVFFGYSIYLFDFYLFLFGFYWMFWNLKFPDFAEVFWSFGGLLGLLEVFEWRCGWQRGDLFWFLPMDGRLLLHGFAVMSRGFVWLCDIWTAQSTCFRLTQICTKRSTGCGSRPKGALAGWGDFRQLWRVSALNVWSLSLLPDGFRRGRAATAGPAYHSAASRLKNGPLWFQEVGSLGALEPKRPKKRKEPPNSSQERLWKWSGTLGSDKSTSILKKSCTHAA